MGFVECVQGYPHEVCFHRKLFCFKTQLFMAWSSLIADLAEQAMIAPDYLTVDLSR